MTGLSLSFWGNPQDLTRNLCNMIRLGYRRRNKNNLKMLFLDNGRSLLNEFWFIQNKFSKRVTEASVSDARQGRYDMMWSPE